MDSSCAIAQEQPASDSPDATESPATEDTQQCPEEVLRAAKAASQQAQQSEPSSSSSSAEQSSRAIEKTVTSELQQATSEAAKELVDANSQALQERLQIGVREGLEDAKDIRKGYQLGLLKGLTQAKQTDTRELGEQKRLGGGGQGAGGRGTLKGEGGRGWGQGAGSRGKFSPLHPAPCSLSSSLSLAPAHRYSSAVRSGTIVNTT